MFYKQHSETTTVKRKHAPWLFDDYKPKKPLTPAEMLLVIRSSRESNYRQVLLTHTARIPFSPSFPLERLTAKPFPYTSTEDLPNKSIAIYGLVEYPYFCGALRIFHNYLYRAWYKPYRNNIEFGHFIANFIAPDNGREDRAGILPALPAGQQYSQAQISEVINQVGDLHRHIITGTEKMLAEAGTDPSYLFKDVANIEHYTIRPLFRSLIMVLAEYDIHYHGANYRDDFGQQRIYLFRVDDKWKANGLSQPISFDVLHDRGELLEEPVYRKGGPETETRLVQTTVRAATQFILEIIEREDSFWGKPFEPVLRPLKELEMRELTRLGWKGGDEITGGKPSSKWVSDELAASWGWTGESAWLDWMLQSEEQLLWEDWDGRQREKLERDKEKEKQKEKQRDTEGDQNAPAQRSAPVQRVPRQRSRRA